MIHVDGFHVVKCSSRPKRFPPKERMNFIIFAIASINTIYAFPVADPGIGTMILEAGTAVGVSILTSAAVTNALNKMDQKSKSSGKTFSSKY